MEPAHLARLYATKEFADCTFTSREGDEFSAHRFVLSQYPHLKGLMNDRNDIHLAESAEVTERLLRWMYGLNNWKVVEVEPTREGVGIELTGIMGLCDIAQKVRPNLIANVFVDGLGMADHTCSTPSQSSETAHTAPWAKS